MAQVGYPPEATQVMVEQHKELRLRILEFRQNEKLNVLPIQSYILDFLNNHEFKQDRELADWIQRQDETSHAA